MKSHIFPLVITFLLLPFSAISQTNNWAPEGAKWYYGALEGNDPFCDCGYTLMESVGDTTLLNQTCRIIEVTAYGCNKGKVLEGNQYMYEDSGQVFHYYPPFDTFYPLYDFNLIDGDTLMSVTDTVIANQYLNEPSEGHFAYRIDTTYSDTINGVSHKVQRPICIGLPGMPLSTVWGFPNNSEIIEGVGSTYWLYGEIGCVMNSSCFGLMRCYEDDDISLNLYGKPCDLATSVDQPTGPKGALTIYPNPAKEWAYVELDYNASNPMSIRLTDLTGRQVMELQQVTKHGTNLPLQGLADGVYLVEVYAEGKMVGRKQLVKQ